VADTLLQALSAAVRDLSDPSYVNSHLDAKRVLDLLDSIPAALTYAPGGVADTLVNVRLARPDKELSASSLPDEMRARLRSCPLAGPSLFGPELEEASKTSRSEEQALTASVLAESFAQALGKHGAAPPSDKVFIQNRRGRSLTCLPNPLRGIPIL
jgi:hypothetical protein